MKFGPLWVFAALLLGILVLAFFGFLRPAEGFQTGPSPSSIVSSPGSAAARSVYEQELRKMIRCPVGYKPFHSPAGDSLCCKGTINPYTHQCSSKATDAICSLSANVKDPRDPKRVLPLCSTLTVNQLNDASIQTCPTSLPYYAQESEAAAKCCKNPIVIKGEGFGCSTEDMRDRTKYCIAKGPLEVGEQRCDSLAVYDNAVCPTDSAGNQVFKKITYELGAREADKYKIPDLKNVSIPVCFRLNETCIPTSSLQYAQTRGAYTEYGAGTWEYSCENWEKRVKRGELAPDTVRGYLTQARTQSSSAPGPA